MIILGHIFQSVLFTICIQCRGPTTPATPSFKKAGVILWQISPDNPRQQDLFDPIDRSKQKALMEAIDAINRKNGHGTIRQAVQGTGCRFDLKREYMSKRFTTDIHEILKVKTK